MRKPLLLTLTLLGFCFGSIAQTLQQEQRESRRRNNNPFQPPAEKTKIKEVYKLRGYTDSTQVMFSTLASCHMTCMLLDEKDVRTVLKEGLVNVSRSDVASAEKVFAVEYDSGKKLRVVVSPKGYSLLVITVNPMDKKLDCDCKK